MSRFSRFHGSWMLIGNEPLRARWWPCEIEIEKNIGSPPAKFQRFWHYYQAVFQHIQSTCANGDISLDKVAGDL